MIIVVNIVAIREGVIWSGILPLENGLNDNVEEKMRATVNENSADV